MCRNKNANKVTLHFLVSVLDQIENKAIEVRLRGEEEQEEVEVEGEGGGGGPVAAFAAANGAVPVAPDGV